jgi:transposase
MTDDEKKKKGVRIIFQQDNDPKHRANINMEYLDKKIQHANDKGFKLEVLDWPSQSPDLNPIEHIWKYIKGRLGDKAEYPRKAKNGDELFARIEHEWKNVPQSVRDNLVKSMQERCRAVVRARGGSTKY